MAADETGTALSQKHQFQTLDGLRGVAAIAVMTRHLPQFLGAVSYHGRAGVLLGPTPKSYLAVDFFFVLSGFVLAHAYQARLQAGMGPGRFLLMRVIRRWPL